MAFIEKIIFYYFTILPNKPIFMALKVPETFNHKRKFRLKV